MGESLHACWHGTSSMKWCQIKSLSQWISMHRTPKVIIVGTQFQKMWYLMRRDFKRLFQLFPNTLIVWSDILRRLRWKYCKQNTSNKALDKKHKGFNTLGHKMLQGYANGCVIKHITKESSMKNSSGHQLRVFSDA